MVYSLLIGFIAVLPLCAEQKITSTSTRVQPPPAELPSYNVLRTDQGIHIDGHSKETDWQLAPTLDFIMPWSDVEKEGAQSTIAGEVNNAIAPVLVTATFGVAAAILTESSLAFLGLGESHYDGKQSQGNRFILDDDL